LNKINKKLRIQRYTALCNKEENINIFHQPWWLDSVCGQGNWDVCLVEKNGVIIAFMPYMIKKRYGFKVCSMPKLTQNLGPWFRLSLAKYAKQLSQQKKLMNELILKLPKFDYFLQNWHYSMTNWLPFYWKGYQQTTGYTYVIEDLSDLKKIWSNLQENIRGDIRKAENRFGLTVKSSTDIGSFLHLNKMTFERQNKTPPYSEEFIINLNNSCARNNSRMLFIATDDKGRNHAGVYIVWDSDSAYYLIGGSDYKLRNSGAVSLCLWEAIKFASTVTNKFNFEGSMIEPIERNFRAFGAIQKPYYSISKTPSVLLRITLFALTLRRG
jgi:hypothetical protein